MLRKFWLCLAFIFLFGVITSGESGSAWAAWLPQEDAPPAPPDPLARLEGQIPRLPGAPEQEQMPASPSVFPDPWGKMVSQKLIGDDYDITLTNGDGYAPLELTDNTFEDLTPKLNHGCTKIVFASDRVSYQAEIYTMNLDGMGEQRLTYNTGHDLRPDWSWDGTRIVYQSQVDGQYDIYVMDANGANQTRLTADPGYDGQPTFSPDGSRIAFTSNRSGVYAIWVMNADGSNPVGLTTNLPYSELAFWSPDGSTIAFTADGDGDSWYEVWKMNTDGSGQTRLTSTYSQYDAIASSWSPDGYDLAYTGVKYVYYYGNWYWQYAHQFVLNVHTGWITRVNQAEDRSWHMDWKSTDVTPPASSMAGLPATSIYQFPVSWSGSDGQTGLKNFSVQYKDGSGAWTDWLVHTASTSADFTGIGGHTYYFRVRAYDQAYNAEPWPANPQASTTVESQPPITNFGPLPEFWRSNAITVTWDGYDLGGSGIAGYDVQYKDLADGDWRTWLTDYITATAGFAGDYGHTYAFRLRGRDNAQNVEPWSGSGNHQVTLYAWAMSGQVFDNTGTPISGALPQTSPVPFLSFPSSHTGAYALYTATNPYLKSASWARPGYGSLPETSTASPSDTVMDAYLPPADDIVQDGGFESGSLAPAWQTGGVYTPTISDAAFHSGNYAALVGETPTFLTPEILASGIMGDACRAQDASDNLHIAAVTWTGSNYSLVYRQRLALGVWLPLEIVAEGISGDANCVLGASPDGTAHLVWEGLDSVNYRSRSSSGTWSAVQNPIPGEYWGVLMVMDANHTLHLIGHYTGMIVYAQLPNGGVWSEPETITGDFGGWNFYITVSTTGIVHILQDNYFSWMYVSRNAAGVWSEIEEYDSELTSCYSAVLIPDSDGNLHVISQCSDNDMIEVTRSATGVWSNPTYLAPGGKASKYSAILDNQGTLHLVFISSEYPYDSSTLYYLTKINGANWSSPYAFYQDGCAIDDIQIAAGKDNNLTIVWNGCGLQLATRVGETWSEPIQIYIPASAKPFLLISSFGAPHIFWGSAQGLRYTTLAPAAETGNAQLSQTLTLTPSLEAPVLSFLYLMSGAVEDASAGFSVQVSDALSTTTLLSTTTNTGWQHAWFDLSPWLSQTITLTFQAHQVQGYPAVAVYLDEVSLGSSYPDTWVQLTGSPASAQPGQQVTLLLQYGNRGGALASGVGLDLTLPDGLTFLDSSLPPTSTAGQALHWDLGDLPARGESGVISLTVEIDSAAPRAVDLETLTSITASRELETANNSAHFILFTGARLFMPMIQR